MPSFSSSKKSPSKKSSSARELVPSKAKSLRDIVQETLLDDVFKNSTAVVDKARGSGANVSDWMVLVVDPESLRVISSSVGMYNLMEHRVSIVEDLTKKRAPFRDQTAVYFVEPREESVRRIVEDWTPPPGGGGKVKRGGPPYGDCVLLYFLGRLPEELFGLIKNCKELVKRVRVLKEVNLDFLTKEAGAFHFDMKDRSLYSDLYLTPPRSSDGLTPLQDRMISKLVTVCATLNEYPHVRYPARNALCAKLADHFQRKMNEFVGANGEWWYNGDGVHPDSQRSTLLVLDRRDDCLSPLIHEFTYEAMVNDLLPIEDERITYENVAAEGAKTDALLNDNDEIWVEIRGKHIADVIQKLSAKIRGICNSSTGSAFSGSAKASGKALSINQMAKALKALPEYREIMSKLSQHMQIAHQCMDKFSKQGLLKLSDLEQTLATGKTDEGATPKLKPKLGQVVEMFRDTEVPLDSLMRLRLLAIVIVSQRGLPSNSDLQKLLNEANLSQKELAILYNLEKMGSPLVQRNPRGKSVQAFGPEAAENESEYSSSRYVSLLKPIIEDCANGTLSVEDYPSVMPLPDEEAVHDSAKKSINSVRKSAPKSKWNKSSSGPGGKKKIQGARSIVFMAGGMCYSELRAAREVMVSTGTEVVVGSTRFISPLDFIEDLKSLK